MTTTNATGGTTTLLDGKKVAKEIRAEVAERAAAFAVRHGRRPGLSVVLVGEDPASTVYVRNKEKAASEAGIAGEVLRFPAETSQAEIAATVDRLNADPEVDGILVQLPLPDGVDERAILARIDPDKDVDGFHPVNAGRLSIGLPGLVPCTPAGVIELLERHDVPLKGRHAVVVGRSNIVGKPMALLLLRKHCTVTICHSRTADLAAVCREADILVAAVGRVGLIGADHVNPGAAVVDVGIHRVTDEATVRRLFGDDPKRLAALAKRGGTLAGDVVPVEVRERAGWFSPVPGGVGPLTIALLLRNTLDAAERSADTARPR